MNALLGFFPIELHCFASEFLAHARAHAREELSPQDRARIEAFVRGDSGDSERQALLPVLWTNVTALEYLAALLVQGPSCGEEE